MARQGDPLLSDGINRYLDWRERDEWRGGRRGAAKATIRSYRAELKRFQQFVEASGRDDPSFGDIDRELLRRFQRSIERDRRDTASGTRPLSRGTTRRRLVVLRQLLRFAEKKKWLREDLTSIIVLPRFAAPLPKALDKKHLESLISSVGAATLKEKRDKAFILLLLSTGASLSEVLRLDRRDLRHNELTLRGKGGSQRTAVLTTRARKAVETYDASRRDRSLALFISFQPARKGTTTYRLTPTGARHICTAISHTLQIPSFNPRELRNTTGTLLQKRVGDPFLTAAMLGLVGPKSVAGYRRLARKALEKEGL